MPPNIPIVTPDFLFSSSVKRGNKSNEFDLALSNASTDSKTEEFKLAASPDETPPPPGLAQLKTGEIEDALASALAALLIAPIPTILPIAEDGQTVTPPTTAAAPATPEASSTVGKTDSLAPMLQTLTAATTTDVEQALPLAKSAPPTLPEAKQENITADAPDPKGSTNPSGLPPKSQIVTAAQPVGEKTVSTESTLSNEANPLPKGEVAKVEVSNITVIPGEAPKETNVKKEEGATPQSPSRITESIPARVEANQPVLQTNAHAPDPKGFENPSGLSSPMAQLPEPVRDVVMTIHRLMQVGASEVKMQLQPESLGRVDVQLTYDGGQVRVHLSAENSNTGALLQEHSHTLRAALVEAGVSVGQLTVNVGHGGAQHGRHFAAQQNELSNRYRQRHETQIEPVAAIVTPVKNGRMDIKL
ncbi:MAG: flagellar hook-length control protein FliK [Chloroflexi bacterium]|nr:flagellar hook-length control protein FliK [Chloroflexota bacterium]